MAANHVLVLYDVITMFHVSHLSNCKPENKKDNYNKPALYKNSGRPPKVVPHKTPKGCPTPRSKQLEAKETEARLA